MRRGGRRWDRYVSCEGPLSRAQPLPIPEPQAWHHLPRGLASSGLHPWHGECHRRQRAHVRPCEGRVERGHSLPRIRTRVLRRRRFKCVEVFWVFGTNREGSSDYLHVVR